MATAATNMAPNTAMISTTVWAGLPGGCPGGAEDSISIPSVKKKRATGRCQSRRQNNVCRNVVATTIRKQIDIKVYETRRDK